MYNRRMASFRMLTLLSAVAAAQMIPPELAQHTASFEKGSTT